MRENNLCFRDKKDVSFSFILMLSKLRKLFLASEQAESHQQQVVINDLSTGVVNEIEPFRDSDGPLVLFFQALLEGVLSVVAVGELIKLTKLCSKITR